MKKDFKTGMFAGLVLVIVCTIWLSTRPGLSTQMLLSRSKRPATAPEPAQQGQSSILVDRQLAQRIQPRPATPQAPARNTSPQADTSQSKAPARASVRTHTVQADETLSEIARKYYGSPGRWRDIYQANKSAISNPDKVSPGTKLVIP